MTPLADLLIRRISATGPITIADYMAECLLHPQHGYYTTRDPFGQAGDFTTAPEISQMFGEMLGLCIAQSWLGQGAPDPFTLAELGPGRGTLMADALRATARVPGFHAAARVTLVEASPRLRARQRETLGEHPVTWTDDVTHLPEAPLFLIANEFFDALPIRQFIRRSAGWQERMVGVTEGRLAFGLSAPTPLDALQSRLTDTAPGDMVETCAPATAIAADIAGIITRNGGVALLLDYGDARSRGDTLQALKSHAFTDPLVEPGQADLTAHVDFGALAQAAAPCPATRMTPQGILLERLGITARAQTLAQRLTGPALDAHVAAHRRLTHPSEMGQLFKALAFYAPGAPPPPGFD
ncbi:MAG: methyltransferase [Cereibacter sphaeroides]|uniref:Methyltransferase n=1 Tax=Cereibacter sphaeroides TaxID=1063 RepID=A0A2W5SEM7_CERSP|nr:MAG: methyltransferase [Cereibacter sphaeroides]